MRKIAIIFVYSILVCSSRYSYSQIIETIAPFASAMSINSVIGSIRNGINDVIEVSGGEMSNQTFEIRQHAQILLDQADFIVQNNIGKTFGELTKLERQTLNDINTQLQQLAKLEKTTAKDIERTLNQVTTLMANIPFMESTPRLISYQPLYLMSPERLDGSQEIVFDGALLSNGRPILNMGNSVCKLISSTDIQVRFDCPANDFSSDDSVKMVTGSLTLHDKPTFFGRVSEWFGSEPPTRNYTISLRSFPQTMGSYEVTAYVGSEILEIKSRMDDFGTRNGHCRGDRTYRKEFNSTSPEWKIDTDKIGQNCRSSSNSSCRGLENVSQNSFQVVCEIQNRGDCFGPAKDARGSCSGSVTWKETRKIATINQNQIDSGTIEWGKDIVVPLPEKTTSVMLKVILLGGNEIVVLSSQDSPDHDWISLSTPPATDTAIIKSKSVKEAMN